MQKPALKKLSTFLIIATSIIIFGAGIFGTGLVHSEGYMEEHGILAVCDNSSCKNPTTNPICVSNCLSAFVNSLQSLPVYQLNLVVFVLAFGPFLTMAVRFYGANNSHYIKIYICKRRERFVLSFFAQLGSWLIIFEKRDPAVVFAFI